MFFELQNSLPHASRQLLLVQLGHQHNDHRLLQHVDAIVPFAIDVPLFLTRSHFRYQPVHTVAAVLVQNRNG